MLSSLLTYLLTCVCVVLVSLSSYLLWVGAHWRRKGVPSYGNPISGVIYDTFRGKRSAGDCLKEMFQKNKKMKFYGTYVCAQPVLVVQDLEIIRQVLVKSFSNFNSRGMHYDLKKDPLSGTLFRLAGEDWKFMRSKLTPTFSSAKTKFMFGTVQDCISTIHEVIDTERMSNNDVVNINELFARLSTDVISSVAFGIETNSVNDADSVFRKMGKTHVDRGLFRFIHFLVRMNPKIMKFIPLKAADAEVNQFFYDAFTRTVEHREKHNATRNDFLDLMIRMKNENNTSKENGRAITMGEIAAQSFSFFFAGFETTSNTIAFTLLELAKHRDIQNKVREECDQVMRECGGRPTYDSILNMDYTEKVIHETLRFYPSAPIIQRAVTKACTLPETDVILEKDTLIWIPVHGLHLDEDVFPDPLKFDPERFDKENRYRIPQCGYMPFSEGPRICIGLRFAMVEMKAVLCDLLTKYIVELSDETDPNPKLHKTCAVLSPEKSIKLKMTTRCKVDH